MRRQRRRELRPPIGSTELPSIQRLDTWILRYGPAGDTPSVPRLRWQLWALRPGLDEASRPSTTPHGTRQTAGFRMARRTGTVGVGVRRRRQAGGLGSAWSAWCRVRGDFGKAMAAHQGRGGGRAARPRPTPTPTVGPGARRVPRRAPLQSEPPGGLVRPLNTWPHDRHDSRRSSSLRSAVIARDSPVRWPGGTGLASLPPLPATRLPLRVRQHHKTIATPLRNGPRNTANTGPPARRPGRWRSGERVQLVVHREGDRPAGAPHPRVTRRPPCGSDTSYGPCGPAWTGASWPSTTIHETRRTVGLGIGARRVPRRASGPG